MLEKPCQQCGKEVMPGEDFCWECIIEDAITMGIINNQNDINSKLSLV